MKRRTFITHSMVAIVGFACGFGAFYLKAGGPFIYDYLSAENSRRPIRMHWLRGSTEILTIHGWIPLSEEPTPSTRELPPEMLAKLEIAGEGAGAAGLNIYNGTDWHVTELNLRVRAWPKHIAQGPRPEPGSGELLNWLMAGDFRLEGNEKLMQEHDPSLDRIYRLEVEDGKPLSDGTVSTDSMFVSREMVYDYEIVSAHGWLECD